MHTIKFGVGVAALAAATAAALLPAGADARADAAGSSAAGPTEYVVVYAGAARAAGDASAKDSPAYRATAAHRAIAAAGGEVLTENADVGTALVRSAEPAFATLVRAGGAVLGAARNRPIGHAPSMGAARDAIERLSDADRAAALERLRAGEISVTTAAPARPASAAAAATPEPLADAQWDMAMIGATPEGSYATELGDRRVKVGIMDTGVDGSHPDVAPNFDAALSRNFTTDIPDIDGECEVAGCEDPADVDENGHGTHIAATIGAPINGLGIAGVAPEVSLVNVRAGQDSGFFFLQSVVDALTYSGDAGLDVVNMSFYVDPWLYNCEANPADSVDAQLEQQTVREAVQRALDYAITRGVTPVGALGNASTDLGDPTFDASSPNQPAGAAYERTIDNSCLTVPAESDGVISVAALGPSGRKAYYSNYGVEQNDVSAPGGDAFDTADNKVDPAAQILAAVPEALARANGDIDDAGMPTSPFVVRDCTVAGICGYYQYLQGTSMAAPHAAGVAALAVSRFGLAETNGISGAGLRLEPALTELALLMTAQRVACPVPAEFSYTINGAQGEDTFAHTCETGMTSNGFYGAGIVNAASVALLPELSALTP